MLDSERGNVWGFRKERKKNEAGGGDEEECFRKGKVFHKRKEEERDRGTIKQS